MQSLGWSERISSRTVFLRPSIGGVDVTTSIPSLTGVVHDVTGLGIPFTSTIQSLQPPKGVSFGCWQSVGIEILASLAASRIVAFSGVSISLPSIVTLTMTLLPLYRFELADIE